VDTEPQLAADLKAVLHGLCRFCGRRIRACGRRRGTGEEAADGDGKEASDLVAALFGGEGSGVVGSHGALQAGAAHSDLRLATGALSGGERKRDSLSLLYARRERFDGEGVNWRVISRRRVGEFFRETFGVRS
jgi:hypothetical protein